MSRNNKAVIEEPKTDNPFAFLPQEFRPEGPITHFPKPSISAKRIQPTDDMPMTDSGYWLHDFVQIPIKRVATEFTSQVIAKSIHSVLYVPPPQGWLCNWTVRAGKPSPVSCHGLHFVSQHDIRDVEWEAIEDRVTWWRTLACRFRPIHVHRMMMQEVDGKNRSSNLHWQS